MSDECGQSAAGSGARRAGERGSRAPGGRGPSRRTFLKASAGAAAVGAAAQVLPGRALAQQGGAPDAELRRVQDARRVLLKGGVVLSMDPSVGDFSEADVLIEDGK